MNKPLSNQMQNDIEQVSGALDLCEPEDQAAFKRIVESLRAPDAASTAPAPNNAKLTAEIVLAFADKARQTSSVSAGEPISLTPIQLGCFAGMVRDFVASRSPAAPQQVASPTDLSNELRAFAEGPNCRNDYAQKLMRSAANAWAAAKCGAVEQVASVPDGAGKALHAAVAALYFDDSSDFRSSLGAVVRHLDAVLAGELLVNPKAAYDKACAALAAQPAVASTQQPVELMGVDEQIKDGAGFWYTCSGCHDTEDGHPTGNYSYSSVFKCALGSGCSECGGLGAVWDNNDYSDELPDLAASTGKTGELPALPKAVGEVRTGGLAVENVFTADQMLEYGKLCIASTLAPSAEEVMDEALREAVAEGLRGLYGCGRVWSAWSVGTMGEDDFYPADESDECIGQVVDAIRALRTTTDNAKEA